jgi:DNA-binding response OmpR family regulator
MANILIIDDEPYLEKLLSEDLSEQGHRITSASSAEKAVEKLYLCKPDIILLDLHLEGFERWDLLHRIKLEDSLLPVLIVTAYNGFINEPRLAEADGYVIKDIYTDALIKKIEELLARHDLNHRKTKSKYGGRKGEFR